MKTILAISLVVLLHLSSMAGAGESGPPLPPVKVGLTAEYGLKNSYSAQAVEMGIRVAMEEINRNGGVLGGRMLALETRDDRSVPARAIENVKELAGIKDLVAVFGARFSPVYLELLPLIHELGLPLMDPWGSADGITDHQYSPSYSFRLSLKDSYAMPHMFQYGLRQGLTRYGLLVPNTGWGRSNEKAALGYASGDPRVSITNIRWYNWGDVSFLDLYLEILKSGAEALILVANDREGGILINEIGRLPESQRIPILSHWGVAGGSFFETTKANLETMDITVIQTFSLQRARQDRLKTFMKLAEALYGTRSIETIDAQVGVGQAFDLMHLLAMAVDKAGSTDRAAIREALEHLGPYSGLVDVFEHPFTPQNHEALGPDHVFMGRYRSDGILMPVE